MKRLGLPRWMRWRERIRAEKQLAEDRKFWGLVNDHSWLQYHPIDERLRRVIHTPRRSR